MSRKKSSITVNSLFSSLIVLVLILSVIGLFFVFEVSTAESFRLTGHQFHFLFQQSKWLLLGLALMVLAIFIPSNWWQQTSFIFYLLTLVLLFLIFIPGFGIEINGARRWLQLSFFRFQPVELLKLTLVLFFSSWLCRHQRIRPLVFFTSLPVLLLFFQPDLGSLLVVISISVILYFVAGGDLWNMAKLLVFGLLFITISILVAPYRLRRVQTFFTPDTDITGTGFHVRQLKLALGSGGLFGRGIGQSKQKYSYIPEASTDSIFAIIGEELGFMGSLLVLTMLFSFTYLCFKVAKKYEPQSFEYLLCVGIASWVGIQTILNVAAVSSLIPFTGLPLPFFSAGGSSLVSLLMASGIVLRLSIQSK